MDDSNFTLSPSNSMLVPLWRCYGGDAYANHRNMALAPPTISRSRLVLPPGWGVEEVPRPKGRHIDRYYYEPGTGRKFRSSREVQRYLYGEGIKPRRPMRHRMVVRGGKMLRIENQPNHGELAIVPRSPRAAPFAPYNLPDGWIVEKVPRLSGRYDTYYYEPGTGHQFRSLVSVERYLAMQEYNATLSKALVEIKENEPLSKVFKIGNHTKNSAKRSNTITGENTQASSFVEPPMKVNWVLASPEGDIWNPYISDMLVPDSVKEQWTKRLEAFMKD